MPTRAQLSHPSSRVRSVRFRVLVPVRVWCGVVLTANDWEPADWPLRDDSVARSAHPCVRRIARQMDAKRCDSYQRCNDPHGVDTYRGSSDAATATMCTNSTVPLPPRPSPPVRRPRSQASARSGHPSSSRIAAICMAERRGAFLTPKEHAAPLGVADWRDGRLRANYTFGAGKGRCVRKKSDQDMWDWLRQYQYPYKQVGKVSERADHEKGLLTTVALKINATTA